MKQNNKTMARPRKYGIEYFSLDVDIFEDEKVIPVSSEFGAKGECIIIRVLCAIYREGYFALCSDSFKYKIAKQANLPETLVTEVINGLVRWGFFDKTVFDSFGVLTSRRIQKNWKQATQKRVAKTDLEYWILELPTKLSGFLPPETTLTPTETPQSKLNKIKLNKKEKIIKKEKKQIFKIPTIEEIEIYSKEINFNLDAKYFWNYYEQRDWRISIGKNIVKMKSWKKAVNTWKANEGKYNNNGYKKDNSPVVPKVKEINFAERVRASNDISN